MSTEGKKRNGQFAKGTSGNPSGRPSGSRNKVTLLVEALLEGEAEKLTRKAIELALAGDIHALRMCLDRLTPPCKDRLVQFELPPAQNLDDIGLRIAAILEAVGEGRITPQEGDVLSRILCAQAHLLTTQDLEQRVEKLEQARVQGVPGITTVQGVHGVPNEPGESGELGVFDAQGVSGALEQVTPPDPDNLTILRRSSWEVTGGRGNADGESSPELTGGLRFRLESIGKGPRVLGVQGVQGTLSKSGVPGVSMVLGEQGKEGVSGAQRVSSEPGESGESGVSGVSDVPGLSMALGEQGV
jgi:hypothetical protein